MSQAVSPEASIAPALVQETLVDETTSLLGNFPYSLVLKITASEPRDVLQSERTCLTFIRFSTTLFFAALGIILNFKIDSSGIEVPDTHKQFRSTTSTVVAYILLVFSLLILVISGFNYMVTIGRYAKHKIKTHGFNNFVTVVCITGVVVTLMAINILLLIEGYIS